MTRNTLTVLASVRIGVPGKYQDKKRGFRGHGMRVGLMMPHVNAALNRRRVARYDQRYDSAPVLHGGLPAIRCFIEDSSLPLARKGQKATPVKYTSVQSCCVCTCCQSRRTIRHGSISRILTGLFWCFSMAFRAVVNMPVGLKAISASGRTRSKRCMTEQVAKVAGVNETEIQQCGRDLRLSPGCRNTSCPKTSS